MQNTPQNGRLTATWSRGLLGFFVFYAVWVTPSAADIQASISRVKPAVLIVGTFKPTNSPRFTLRGTGFVVDGGAGSAASKLGATNLAITNFAITNAHVLPDSASADPDARLVVQVRNAQNELDMRDARVLEVDKMHDLALLQFDGAAVPHLALRDSDSVREGQAVAFMGFPIGGALGFSPVTHRGMVSSITDIALPSASGQQLNARTIRSLRDGSFNIFQLDATAYPGNSGGPLFDPDTGEVLGVLNMVFVKGTKESALTHPSGISYAIPSKFIAALLARRGGK